MELFYTENNNSETPFSIDKLKGGEFTQLVSDFERQQQANQRKELKESLENKTKEQNTEKSINKKSAKNKSIKNQNKVKNHIEKQQIESLPAQTEINLVTSEAHPQVQKTEGNIQC